MMFVKATALVVVGAFFINIVYMDLAWAKPQGNLRQTKGTAALTAVWAGRSLSPSQNKFIVNSSEFIAWRKTPKKSLSTMNYKLLTALLRPVAFGESELAHKGELPQPHVLLAMVKEILQVMFKYHKDLKLCLAVPDCGFTINISYKPPAVQFVKNKDDAVSFAPLYGEILGSSIIVELRRLTASVQRVLVPLRGSITHEDIKTILWQINRLRDPLLQKKVEDIERIYNEEIFPLLDQLISEASLRVAVEDSTINNGLLAHVGFKIPFAIATPLEKTDELRPAEEAISSSLLRPRAADERRKRDAVKRPFGRTSLKDMGYFNRGYSFNPAKKRSSCMVQIMEDMAKELSSASIKQLYVYPTTYWDLTGHRTEGEDNIKIMAIDFGASLDENARGEKGYRLSIAEVLHNALDAIVIRWHKEGKPQDFRRLIYIRIMRDGDNLIIEIANDGKGIEKRILEKLFKREIQQKDNEKLKEEYQDLPLMGIAGEGVYKYYGRRWVEEIGGTIEIDTCYFDKEEQKKEAWKLIYKHDGKHGTKIIRSYKREQGTSIRFTLPGIFMGAAPVKWQKRLLDIDI